MKAIGSLRTLLETDLEQVLAWRNHVDIRRYMYTQQEIGMAEHRAWFANASTNGNQNLFIYERNDEALGFMNLTRTRFAGVADWGFYLAPDAPKGCGHELGQLALNYAFNHLDYYKVCGQALAFNERSIAFHKRLGFTQEGCLVKQHYDGQDYHDVICFGLLKSDWLQSAQE